ncbi:Potassium channel domain [Trypanosoma melophagium]|uniref:Potassium channel domain n=1 Tax=Trypanosoma melophagium TaxID=715481 RepID=UPI003519D85A|nr:Potassium channel domain [Trypanosoma melophagium]
MFHPRSQMAFRPEKMQNIRSLRKLIEVMDQQYSQVSISILIIHLIMELVSVVFYVWTSMETAATSVSEFHWGRTIFIFEVVLNIVFFLEWILLFFGDDDKRRYLFSWLSIVNAMTSIPMIICGICALVDSRWESSWVPMYLRVWWIRDCVVVLLDYPQVARYMIDITREVLRFLCTLFAVMCTCIGTNQIVESCTGPYISLYDSFYLMVVAFATIGFGDVVPKSTPARLFMIAFIVVAISYFLPLFQRLALIGRQHLQYDTYNSRGGRRPHVILSGTFTELEVDIIIRNFYAGWRKYIDIRIILLSPVDHPPEVKLLVNLPWFKNHVVLMVGDPMKDADLRRADAHHADAIFLFGDTSSTAYHTDYHLIRQSFAINHYDGELPQYLFLRSERHTKHVSSYAAGVVEGERILHHLLGLGVTVPGSVPLIINLLRTYEPRPFNTTLTRNWVEHYEWSLQNDIYSLEIGDGFIGLDFCGLASLFFKHDVTLMGVITAQGTVSLNPSQVDYSVTKVVVIAKSLKIAREVVKKLEQYCRTPFLESGARPEYNRLVLNCERDAALGHQDDSHCGVETLLRVDDAYDFENHFVIIDLSMAKARIPETEGSQEGSLFSAAADVYHVMRSIRQSYPQNDIVLLTKDTSFSVYLDRYWNTVKGTIPVKHVEGFGLNINDLRRCNLKQSAGIIIFISGDVSGPSTSGLSMLVDLSISSILPSSHNIPIVVEMDSLHYISFFPPYAEDNILSQKATEDFVFEPNYIIGNALSRHMLYPLVHRAYFSEEFIDIIELLVCGVDEETPSLGRLSLLLSPEDLHTYEDVVNYCLNLRYLPIALHRCISDSKNIPLSGQRFVLSNPPRDLPVDRRNDAVFYLLPTSY